MGINPTRRDLKTVQFVIDKTTVQDVVEEHVRKTFASILGPIIRFGQTTHGEMIVIFEEPGQ